MKKSIKSVVSKMLIIVMCFSLFSNVAFAQQQEESAIDWKLPDKSNSSNPVYLLCLGDSTSNGYYLDGYIDELQGIGSNSGDNCYPVKIYNDLVKIYGEDRVIFSQFCINSMRWNELRTVLENSFNKTTNLGYVDSFGQNRTDSYKNTYFDAKNRGLKYIGDTSVSDGLNKEQAWYRAFKDSVEKADIITIDLGMNQFGTYLCDRLLRNIGGKIGLNQPYSDSIEDIKDELNGLYGVNAYGMTPSMALRVMEGGVLSGVDPSFDLWAQSVSGLNGESFNTVTEMLLYINSLDHNTAKATLDAYASGLDEQNHAAFLIYDIVDCIVYGLGSVFLDYDKSMEYIYEANPDAMVIVNGLFNGFNGVNAIFNATNIPLGDYWGELMNIVNGFLSGTDETYAKNRYIDKIRYNAIDMDLSTVLSAIRSFNANPLADYNKKGFDKNTLENIIDMTYLMDDELAGSDSKKTEKLISDSLLQGIRDVVKSNVADLLGNNSIAKAAFSSEEIQEIADYVANKLAEGVLKNCSSDGVVLSAEDVKAAYKNNKKSDFTFSLASIGIVNIFKIINGDYSGFDKVCMNADNSNYAVAAAFDVIRQNIVKAANLDTINLNDLLSFFSGSFDAVEAVAPALVDFESASPIGQALLHLCVRTLSLRGIGVHPSAEGAESKYISIKDNLPEMKLTIHYVYENGKKAADDYLVSPSNGAQYSVVSPSIEGYTPDIETVSGTMGKDPVVETVTYTKNESEWGYCKSEPKEVTLSEGNHHIYYGKTDMGEFDFSASGSGWTIRDEEGYLAVVNNTIAHSNAPFVWKYSNKKFSCSVKTNVFWLWSTTSTKYLTVKSGKFSLDSSSAGAVLSICDLSDSLTQHVPAETVMENVVSATCSSFGTHDEVIYCSLCHEELSRTTHTGSEYGEHHPSGAVIENKVDAQCEIPGSYDEVVYCAVCNEELSRTQKIIEPTGHKAGKESLELIDNAWYEVVRCERCNAVLSQEQAVTGGYLVNVQIESKTNRFMFWFSTKEYTVKINANSVNPYTKIKTIKYSTDNRTWKNGSQFTTMEKPEKLYIAITNTYGRTTYYVYENGETRFLK